MRTNEPNWGALISEQGLSGETIDEFCMNRGVNKYTFKKRKYGSANKAKVDLSEFIEIPRGVASLNIKLKNGRILEVSSGFNESDVHRLIKLLESC